MWLGHTFLGASGARGVGKVDEGESDAVVVVDRERVEVSDEVCADTKKESPRTRTKVTRKRIACLLGEEIQMVVS